jgi:uncharacterized protein YciI
MKTVVTLIALSLGSLSFSVVNSDCSFESKKLMSATGTQTSDMESGQPAQPVYYAILLTPGDNWVAGKSVYEQNLAEHGKYMKVLLDEKKLFMAGPFTDNGGALIILKAKSADDALEIMNRDPAVQNKTFKAELHEWRIFFLSDTIKE